MEGEGPTGCHRLGVFEQLGFHLDEGGDVAAAGDEGVREAPSPGRVGLLLGGSVAPTALGVSAPAVALPDVATGLSLPGAQTAWVLAAYALALAVGTAVSGRAAALYGLRRTLVAGEALLVVGSAVAATSTSFTVLVIGRGVQGAGAGAVTIAALGLISARYEPADAARALGAMTGVVAALAGAGSLIGGALTETLGWRSVVALPALSALTLVGGARLAPSKPTATGRLDAIGALLVTTAVASVIVLLQARSTRLPVTTALLVAAAAVAAAAASALHVKRRPDGFLPLQIVRNGLFLRHALVGFTLFAGYLAMLFVAPLMLFQRQGLGPLSIGLALLPAAVGAVIASHVVGRVLPKLGVGRVTGALGAASGLGLLLAATFSHPAATVVGLTAAVSGFAGGQVSLIGAVPKLVPKALTNTAIAVFNLIFITGGSLGSAAAGGISDVTSLATAVGVVAVLPLGGAVVAWRLPAPPGEAVSTTDLQATDGSEGGSSVS